AGGDGQQQVFRRRHYLGPAVDDHGPIGAVLRRHRHRDPRAGVEVPAGVAGLAAGGEPELTVPPQEPQRPDPRMAVSVHRGEVAQPGLGQKGIDLLGGHGHGYFTTSCSTNSSPKPLVKLARSSLARLATSLPMSALNPSRSSHVSTATPSYGASCPSGTRVTTATS